jgi:hypothetical protein
MQNPLDTANESEGFTGAWPGQDPNRLRIEVNQWHNLTAMDAVVP